MFELRSMACMTPAISRHCQISPAEFSLVQLLSQVQPSSAKLRRVQPSLAKFNLVRQSSDEFGRDKLKTRF